MRSILILVSINVLLIACISEDSEYRSYSVLITSEAENITTNGIKLSAQIIRRSDDEIIDHGFVWGVDEEPKLAFENTSFTKLGKLSSLTFTQDINSTLVKGGIYYARAFIQNKNQIIYSSVVQFKSMGSLNPMIDKIEPSITNLGDTVVLFGRYFSSRSSQNRVEMDESIAQILEATETSLKVIVPFITNTNPSIRVIVTGNENVKRRDFLTVNATRIVSVSTNPILCDSIILYGQNFPSDAKPLVSLNGLQVGYRFIDPSTIKTIARSAISNPITVGLTWYEKYLDASFKFNYLKPAITSTSMLTSNLETLVLSAENFPDCLSNLEVVVVGSNSSTQGTILSVLNNEISVLLPPETKCFENNYTLKFLSGTLLLATTEVIITPFQSLSIQSIQPSNINIGQNLVITGTQFHAPMYITFNDIEVSPIFINPQTIMVKIDKPYPSLQNVRIRSCYGETTIFGAFKTN